MIATSQFGELVTYARQHSPYYRKHFAQVAESVSSLDELPIIDGVTYWQDCQHLSRWPVLTRSIENALVFKTGGTTSGGKLSVFERHEWQALVKDFGNSLTAHLEPGDRVANLFFAGDLYASFIFVHDALAHVASGVVEFPFTGQVDSMNLADSVQRHRINVLAGVPAQLLTFAAWLEREGRTLEGVDTLLYGGESLFAAQQRLLRRVFPNVRLASMGYASVDAGFIGVSDRGCALGEHRVLERHSVVEIIDEQTGEVIRQSDRPGVLVVTNLTRRLMPLIRYPVGDRACWREPPETPNRKFALLGRSAGSQRVRVGILTLLIAEIGDIVQRIAHSEDWQLLIEQTGEKDLLSLKWQADTQTCDLAAKNRQLRTALLNHYPLIEQLESDCLLALRVTHCLAEDLSRHPRSGKHQRVVDLRVYDDSPLKPERWTP
ncbi:phenylacetate--CoA ligase family protein [Pseudomonas sp. B2M1-30]|uniref:phenylacetate--CoA ligase family protein n=1 Tax=Pseudomonas TaxID=286 RepID=UPI0021C8FA8F|nr:MULTISPECIES: AMP-binding protein [Pseudomonas]MCU0121882.1 phenylacetate--CoA ligase family protein [Pseudomonas sp. B2M1-30]MCU7264003.1 phenylacetate--CoA ligase family protein [Pseudomonas koreensis]